MDYIYILFTLALIILPLVGVIALNYIPIINFTRSLWLVFVFYLLHNILFLNGYSIKDDYPDYIIFALEFPFFVLIMISAIQIRRNIYTKTLRIMGYICIVLGIVYGCLNALFGIENQDYDCVKTYRHESNNKAYTTRLYTFGFATLISTKYTFDTYRSFEYLPFEKMVDRSMFFDSKTDFDLNGPLYFKVNEAAG